MFEQLRDDSQIARKPSPPPIDDELSDIEERLEEIEGEIDALEDERWNLERKQEKLEKKLETDPDAMRRRAEKEQAEADERKQRYLIERRYGHPFVRDLSDYWSK